MKMVNGCDRRCGWAGATLVALGLCFGAGAARAADFNCGHLVVSNEMWQGYSGTNNANNSAVFGAYCYIPTGADAAVAQGVSTRACGYASYAQGWGSQASGTCAHAEGYMVQARADASHAENQATIASGYGSHAEGYSTTSSAHYAHSEGDGTLASGRASHAEGTATRATTNSAHAEGDSTIASNTAAHAEGYGTIAGAANSHAGGIYAQVLAGHTNALIHATGTSGSPKQTLYPDTAHFDRLILLASANNHTNSVLAKWEMDQRYARLEYVSPQGGLSMGSYTNQP